MDGPVMTPAVATVPRVTRPRVTRGAGLAARGLVAQRGGRAVLHGVSLAAPAGEVTGLVGPNGAGKTTTLEAIAGVCPLREGSIRVFAERPTIGFAPQEAALYPPLTVAENLAVFAAYAGVRRAARAGEVGRALELAGLEGVATRRAGRLSIGQRRRLSLAVATLGSPAVLLFDEPTAGVDPQARHHMIEAIGALAREAGAAVVFSSHRLDEIETVCDTAVIIDHGRVVTEGPVADLRIDDPSLEAAFLRLTGVGLRE
ncbi:MAG: ABC transporter ATP-binding protein [Actinobacteria bacterium]|nr:ABC transporter ATP-binding protein [Actinomycetota bacterium]